MSVIRIANARVLRLYIFGHFTQQFQTSNRFAKKVSSLGFTNAENLDVSLGKIN